MTFHPLDCSIERRIVVDNYCDLADTSVTVLLCGGLLATEFHLLRSSRGLHTQVPQISNTYEI